MSSYRFSSVISLSGGKAVGSSKINQWERAGKLLASAMKMVLEGSRSVEVWADHLQIFVFGQLRKALVNYDDPAHREYVMPSDLRPEHYPVRGSGQFEVIYNYLEFDHLTTIKEIIQIVESRSDIRLPDIAETMDYHKENPQERMKAPIISLCGSIEYGLGWFRIACIDAHDDGSLRPSWHNGDYDFLAEFRFLVVCKQS